MVDCRFQVRFVLACSLFFHIAVASAMFDKLILSRRRYGATYRQERQRDKTRQPKAAAIEEIDEYQVDFDPDVYERSLSIEDPMGSFSSLFLFVF